MSGSGREGREPGSPFEPPALSEREFLGYQRLVHREAGIWLSEAKRALLVGRVSRRLRELGGLSFGAYLKRVEEDEVERVRLLDALCTHETHFFREPRHFELLERELLPRWRARGWWGGSISSSAATSSSISTRPRRTGRWSGC